MATLRWLLVLVLWAAMDVSAPLVLGPAEAVEELAEETAHAARRRPPRRPARDVTTPAVLRQVRADVERLAHRLTPGPPRHDVRRATVRKLPSSGPDPGLAPDDH
jgi:hypothetical protein